MCTVRLADSDSRWGVGAYLVVTVGASVLAWVAVARSGSAIRFWLAVGVSSSALGDVVYEIQRAVRGTEPDVSLADGPWILAYLGVGVASLLLLRRRHDRSTAGRVTSDGDAAIDIAVVVLLAGLLLWYFWVGQTLGDGDVPVLVRCVWAAYPILDMALLALVVRILLECRTDLRAGALMAVGTGCWLASDFAFMVLAPEGRLSDVLDVGWMVGAVLLAAVCLFPIDVEVIGPRKSAPERVGALRISLALAPLLLPGVIELISYLEGTTVNPIPLSMATAAFAGLAGIRAVRLMRLRDDAQRRLILSEHLYRALADNSSDAVMILDRDGVITNEEPALAALLGHPRVRTRGRRALDFIASADTGSRALFDSALLAPGVALSGETCVARPDSSPLWLGTRAVNLLDDPAVGGIVVNVHDITARKRAEADLVHQAFHDPLTGLPNRALFRDRTQHALDRRAHTGLGPSVVYIDLDGFKVVNDGMGHDAGDELLRHVAGRLAAAASPGDTVARLGGDEFAVLVEEAGDARSRAQATCDRILRALAAPFELADRSVSVSASLGVASAEVDSTASSILRDADIAMYQAKTAGKSRWVLYDPAAKASSDERRQLEAELMSAVAGDELRLQYQPVVELSTARIVGFEALVRWDHPRLGSIGPDRFVAIAEHNGTILPIGRWVLETACRTAAEWRARHGADITMAVNVSARQLASLRLVDEVRETLAATGLDPSALVLEITESALVDDAIQAAAQLHELRNLGVRLAIDDFGTGYSSLSYLRQFPVDILKIDRSFINTITPDADLPPIVRGLLELARTLRLDIVAEGIETPAQLDRLRSQHCDLGQGYLFAQPLDRHAAELTLAAGHTRWLTSAGIA